MTTISVVGLIVLILVVIGLVVTFVSQGAVGNKINLLIQSSALTLTVYQLILKVNEGDDIWLTIILIVCILLNLISCIVKEAI